MKGENLIIYPDCQKTIRSVSPSYCPRRGLPYPSGEAHLCASYLKERLYFEVHCTCAFYEGSLKEAIQRFKYNGVFPLVMVFGNLPQPYLQTLTEEYRVDLMVAIPLCLSRLSERGFNRALLLVREFSKRMGIPYEERALAKIKETPVQITLKKRERRKISRGPFR
jgi:predicted amidophosphoribosyltransferase